jgi:hypothetical protein
MLFRGGAEWAWWPDILAYATLLGYHFGTTYCGRLGNVSFCRFNVEMAFISYDKHALPNIKHVYRILWFLSYM